MNIKEPHKLLKITFAVRRPVRHVPFFTGLLWSAVLRHLYEALPGGGQFSDIGLSFESGTGVVEYLPGDRLGLFLSCPESKWPELSEMLRSMWVFVSPKGHFRVGDGVVPESVICKLSGRDALQENIPSLSFSELSPFVAPAPRFVVSFLSPYHMTVPPEHRAFPREVAGLPYFLVAPDAAQVILSSLAGGDTEGLENIRLKDGCGFVRGYSYGRNGKPLKVFKGFWGWLEFEGALPEGLAERIAFNGLTGSGGKTSFGFGRFAVSNVDTGGDCRPVRTREKSSLRNCLACGAQGGLVRHSFRQDAIGIA